MPSSHSLFNLNYFNFSWTFTFTASAEGLRTGNHEKSLSDEVGELTSDIDEFQKFLADEYAEELANNLEGNNCIAQ
jgi:hypothetical protein